jgi:hypothetical protein
MLQVTACQIGFSQVNIAQIENVIVREATAESA